MKVPYSDWPIGPRDDRSRVIDGGMLGDHPEDVTRSLAGHMWFYGDRLPHPMFDALPGAVRDAVLMPALKRILDGR